MLPAFRRASFLSIQAQDFIEDVKSIISSGMRFEFLSIQAQDFIEDEIAEQLRGITHGKFLSIQAQDFIEEQPARGMSICVDDS